MNQKLREQIRKAFFPEIKNLKEDYHHYKYDQEWYNLPGMVFVFFNNKGSKWTIYGTIIVAGIVLLLLTGYSLFRIKTHAWALWSSLFLMFIFYKYVKFSIYILKIRKTKHTLYEIFLKEESNGQ